MQTSNGTTLDASRAAAPAGAGPRARRGGLTAAGEPPTTWRGRRIEWVNGQIATIADALPTIHPIALTNADGDNHRHAVLMTGRWPAAGPLSTADRLAWSGEPTGTGPGWPPPLQPKAAAMKFARAAGAAAGGRRASRWTLGISEYGEWYTLKAAWPCTARVDGAPVETTAAIWHETHTSATRFEFGLRNSHDGSQVTVHLTGWDTAYGEATDAEAARRASEAEAATRATAIAWEQIRVSRTDAEAWARTYCAPTWGAAAAARAAEAGAAGGAIAAAFALAAGDRRIEDIEMRQRLCCHIAAVTGELRPAERADERIFADFDPAAAAVH